jgi:hypothetical protein
MHILRYVLASPNPEQYPGQTVDVAEFLDQIEDADS